jgi:two-component system, OmpR family, phosphate regulon sensor histidine kinase PhoR
MIWPWKKQETAALKAGRLETAEPRADLSEHLIAAFPDPVLLLDRRGQVIAANAHARGIFDADPRGRHISASIRAPAVLEAAQAAVRGAEPVHVEYELRGPLSSLFDAFIAPVAETGVAGPAALVVLKDLTREQQIERMRADFVANASHELRTPLASLSGFIETLQGAAKSDAKVRQKFLWLMRLEAGRMKRLIDDLLSLSRIEMNERVRPSGGVDLAEVAAHVAHMMAPIAKQEKCRIEVKIKGPLIVTGDWDELVQVVQNLVENAIKYAASGKRIEIEGAQPGGHVELSVVDHGPGIAAEHIPRLTERFYRVSVQESRSRGGTGLGLAIVKHILNRHRGRLIATSEQGRGSRFTIRLPARDEKSL